MGQTGGERGIGEGSRQESGRGRRSAPRVSMHANMHMALTTPTYSHPFRMHQEEITAGTTAQTHSQPRVFMRCASPWRGPPVHTRHAQKRVQVGEGHLLKGQAGLPPPPPLTPVLTAARIRGSVG